MKTLTETAMTLLLALGLAASLVGCAGDHYGQSSSVYQEDASLTSRVEDALAGDTIYKYPGVKVITYKGEVQLSGFVETREQKRQAGQLAKNVPGVNEVVNNITVRE